VVRSGTRYVLTFGATPDPKAGLLAAVYALLLDSEGRASGSPVAVLSGAVLHGLAATSDRAFVVTDSPSAGASIDLLSDLRVLDSRLLSIITAEQRDIAVATDGFDFLSTFSEEAQARSIVAARIGLDGHPLSAPVEVSPALERGANRPLLSAERPISMPP